VNRKREALLQHPLVTALLLYKWKKYGGMVYYSTLIFLITFVALLNSYLLLIPPPYSIDFPKSMANERFYQEFVADHIVNYTGTSFWGKRTLYLNHFRLKLNRKLFTLFQFSL